MGEKIKTFYAYHKELKNDKCMSLYMAEGSIGSVLSRFRGSNTAIAVMCRGSKENETMVELVTKKFRQWFHQDLPKILCHFSFDIVLRYWEEILKKCSLEEESTSQVIPIEIAVLFICDGQCLFWGKGNLFVYEHLPKRACIKRWLTEEERKNRARQLKIKSEDKESEKYLLRKISEKSIFYICSECFSSENLQSVNSQKMWKKYIKQIATKCMGMIVVEVRTTGRIFGK